MVRTRIEVLPYAALALVGVVAGCGAAGPATGGGPSPAQTRVSSGSVGLAGTTSATLASQADPELLAAGLVALASDPSREAVAALPFSESVRLGLGSALLATVDRERLGDPAAWRIEPAEGYFRASTGPFSALDQLARHVRTSGRDAAHALSVTEGAHRNCFGGRSPGPGELAGDQRVVIQPAEGTIDSCIQWFSVDAFVRGGQLVAVTLDIGEP